MSSIVTSTRITVVWEDISCIDRNGRITSYDVMYGVLGEAMVMRSGISGRSFTADDLRPFTNYTVQVRGVNSVDSGPYSDLIIITTGNLIELYTSSMYVCSLFICYSFLSSWSYLQPHGYTHTYYSSVHLESSSTIQWNHYTIHSHLQS